MQTQINKLVKTNVGVGVIVFSAFYKRFGSHENLKAPPPGLNALKTVLKPCSNYTFTYNAGV